MPERRRGRGVRINTNGKFSIEEQKLIENAFITREPFLDRSLPATPVRKLLLKTSAENMVRRPSVEEEAKFTKHGITDPETRRRLYAQSLLIEARQKGIPVDLQGLNEEELLAEKTPNKNKIKKAEKRKKT